MNRDEALKKAVEIAPAGTGSGDVLAYADWLLAGDERISIELLPEGWDDPAEIPSALTAQIGDIGLDRYGNIWHLVDFNVWDVFISAHNGVPSLYSRWTNDQAVDEEVVIVGKVRPSVPSGLIGADFRDLLGQSILERNISDYPVGLLALDYDGDVWEYLGNDEWNYYFGHDGRLARAIYTTDTVEGWRATIVGGIRGQA